MFSHQLVDCKSSSQDSRRSSFRVDLLKYNSFEQLCSSSSFDNNKFKFRVVHQSLIYDNLKQEDTDMPFLNEVLEALQEKYEPTESKVKQVADWVGSQIQCKSESEEGEDPKEENQEEKENSTEKIKTEIEKLEEAHIAFCKKFGEEEEDSPNKEVLKEMEDIKEHITDVVNELEAEKKTMLPLWDKPNEEGKTPLHLSLAFKKPDATSLLLTFNADTNIQDSQGQTPLHLACQQQDIEQATKLVANKAKMIADNRNQTPAMEKLLDNNQDPAKVKKLMAEVYKSTDKVKVFKRILEEDRALFKLVEQPEILGSLLERDEPDPDVEEFVNIQDPTKKQQTALHIAVSKRCYASASVLLKAGSYQLKLDGANLTPDLESLFNLDQAPEITESHVRGLLQKTRMKVLSPEDCWKLLKQQQNEDGKHMNLLSSVKMGSAAWSEVLRLPAKGLKFSIINTEVPAALLAWYKAESAGKGSEEESAVVRKILENKGLVVRESSEETELMPAILSWNEKNKQLCKYSHLSCLFHTRNLCQSKQALQAC